MWPTSFPACAASFSASRPGGGHLCGGLLHGGLRGAEGGRGRGAVWRVRGPVGGVRAPVAFARSPQGGAICRREIPAIWGPEETVPPEDDLFALAQQAAALPQEDRPWIYWAIGKRDFLYKENQRLRQRFDQVGLGYTYEEWDGVHDWAFWGPAVRKAIRFLLG